MRREGIVGTVMQAEIGCLDRSADFEDDRRREAARDAALAARGKESMLPEAMRQLHETQISGEPIEAERMRTYVTFSRWGTELGSTQAQCATLTTVLSAAGRAIRPYNMIRTAFLTQNLKRYDVNIE